MDFSKHPGMLRALSSPQSKVKETVTGSQLSDTVSTTYEGPDALDKSMEQTEIVAKNVGMIIDQTAVLRGTTLVTAKCLEDRGIEKPLQQGSSSVETTIIEVEEKGLQPKFSRKARNFREP